MCIINPEISVAHSQPFQESITATRWTLGLRCPCPPPPLHTTRRAPWHPQQYPPLSKSTRTTKPPLLSHKSKRTGSNGWINARIANRHANRAKNGKNRHLAKKHYINVKLTKNDVPCSKGSRILTTCPYIDIGNSVLSTQPITDNQQHHIIYTKARLSASTPP